MDEIKYNLNRYLEAQEVIYPQALSEIKNAKKEGHWMWFIFPQYKGLGFSETSKHYAIQSIAEAKEYLMHPILGVRLKEISNQLLSLETSDAKEIFGSPDDLKLNSAITLFSQVDDTKESVFLKVIEKFYGGKSDSKTLDLLKK